MERKELERLAEKLRSIHLALPGVVAHLYHLQRALAQGGLDWAWLFPKFHCEIDDWQTLAEQISAQPTHLAEMVRREPTYLGFCNASGLGAGGMWPKPSLLGQDLVWRHPWTEDIITNLVYSTIGEGTITNSELELAALVLHEATLLSAAPEACMADPRFGSDSTPTVSWSTREASMINLVAAEPI